MSDTDAQRDTPRVCEACGGSAGHVCRWCVDGFQTVEQQKDWKDFRLKVSHISGTYSMAQQMVKDMILILEQKADERAVKLASEGREILARWMASAPGTGERAEATRHLMAFHNLALKAIVPPQV